MAFPVTSVRIPASAQLDVPVPTPPTSIRRSPLVCHWVRDPRPGGRLMAIWVADEEVADNEVADSCPQDVVIVRSRDQAVA